MMGMMYVRTLLGNMLVISHLECDWAVCSWCFTRWNLVGCAVSKGAVASIVQKLNYLSVYYETTALHITIFLSSNTPFFWLVHCIDVCYNEDQLYFAVIRFPFFIWHFSQVTSMYFINILMLYFFFL